MAQTKARNNGATDFTSRIIERAVGAPAGLVTRSFEASSDFFTGMLHAGAYKRRIAALEAQISATADYAAHVESLENRLDDMRKMDGFRKLPGKTAIPAEVLGIFAYDNRITISVGSNDGVTPGLPVVSGRGLLAIVQTVDADRSQALLLSSPVTHIGAIAQRNPPPAGLLHGEGGGVLVVEFTDPDAIIQNGDEIVTAGFSERLPRDIPIGRIIKVEDNPDFGTRRGIVFPWASLGAASEVYVLK